jgi:peroxiredoxin
MTLISSAMLPLGTRAPDFALPDVVTGKTVRLADFSGKKALLVMFICRHCPYVKHIQAALAQFGRDYAGKDIGIVAVSANDANEYPEDGPESLREMALSLGFPFPFCYDESQETARAYSAACTPDFFLFDRERMLVYRGQFDDSRPGRDLPVTGRDMREAVNAVLENRPLPVEQKSSIGCSIKWKAQI